MTVIPNKGIYEIYNNYIIKIKPENNSPCFILSWAANTFCGGVIAAKLFWHSWGYNFVSFKGMFQKLMQAMILGSRSILDLDSVFMVTNHMTLLWPTKNFQNSQKFLLQNCVIWKWDTLQKYFVYEVKELVLFEFSNFIFVASQLMMSQNGLNFAHAQY